MAIIYNFTLTLFQSSAALRVLPKVLPKAGITAQAPFSAVQLGNPQAIALACCRSLGVGQICKRGFAASDTTVGSENGLLD